MSNLKEIFNAITPENIKDIPLLKTAMDIFIDNLEENSVVAADISKIYENTYQETDSDIVKAAKSNLRGGLLDVYLSAFFNVISNSQNNTVVKSKLESLGITDVPFINDVKRILNDEYFVTNKSFKEKLGTKTSINYAYNLTKFLESAENGNDMKLYEEKPFHFRTEGSIFKEMYESLVKPLAHPLGFTYSYNQIIKESLSDLFGVEISYNIFTVEIRNIDGRVHVFSESNSEQYVKSLYVGSRINEVTGKVFTDEEYDALVTVYLNKVVSGFTDGIIETRIVRSLNFTDGTFLQQKTNPIEITYMKYADYLAGVNTSLYNYNNSHWSLYVDYESDFIFQYTDEINQYLETFTVTDVKENNNGNNGQKYYNLTSGEYAFHVGGDQYIFAPGQDETENTYTDPAAINDEITSKFGVEVTGSTSHNDLVTLTLTDVYGNTVTKNYIKPNANGDFTTIMNTYPLHGNSYSVKASVSESGSTYTFDMTTTGLNDFAPSLGFTEVYDNYEQTSNTLMVKGFGTVASTVHLTLTDKLGSTVSTTTVVQGDGTWQSVMSLALKEAGDYRVDATTYLPNGKPLHKSFYEASNLRTRIADIHITANIFSYQNGTPDFSTITGYTSVPSIADMPGTNSTSNLILKQIGELAINDTYTAADKDLFGYMVQNGFTDFNQIPKSVILSGAYIEGNDYNKVFQYDLEEEETFIDYGRRVYPISTSDFMIVTSTDYTSEQFLAYSLSTTGYYLYTDEAFGEDYYMYTSDSPDGFYLTTLADEA